MKKILLSVFFTSILSVNSILFAQIKFSKDIAVTTATPYKVQDGGTKEYFYDGNGSAILVKAHGRKTVIQKFSVDGMKEISRKEYEDFPDKMAVQKVQKVGDKIFYIYTAVNKKAKNETLYAREVNQAEGSFLEPKVLFTTDKEVMVSSYEQSLNNLSLVPIPIKYSVFSSFDGSKLLINYRTKPESKSDAKNYDVLGFYVFDNSLVKQWGGEVKMPYTEKVMNNMAYTVTKNGKAHMLAYLNESKRLELFTITSDLKLKTNKIEAGEDLYFQSFVLKEGIDENINCMAYYANGVDFKMNWTGSMALSINTNGLISFKMNQEGKVIEKFKYDFPLELINQYESKRAQATNAKREDKGNAGINDLVLINLSVNSDGSTTVLGEQQYQRNEYIMPYGQKNVSYFADMVVMKIDAKGKLQWMKKLPKTQYGLGSPNQNLLIKGAMSVKYITGKTYSYILYLDNEKNEVLSKDEVPEKHRDGKGGFLAAYKINNTNGDVEKIFFFDTKDINGIEAFQFNPSRIFDVSNNKFLLEIYIKGKQDTMVKMDLGK